MNVTVCELSDVPSTFVGEWGRLIKHVLVVSSDLVLLPEMPFSAWLPQSRHFDSGAWDEAVKAHDRWVSSLAELSAAFVAGTRPVNFGANRCNEGFLWSEADGLRGVHVKSRLRNEKDCWETVWYQGTGAPYFEPVEVGNLSVAFLIGDELTEGEQAEKYGREGVHFILSPRSTPVAQVEEWLEVGRSSARRAGVFTLSSCRAGQGPGWVIGPGGDVLGLTSASQPFVSVAIDTAAT